MTILSTDLVLRKSERLTDNPDGGGRMTGTEVVDAQLNNLFPDISTLDRVLGRVRMRKAFLHVDTNNTDTYYGAFGIITDPPDDPAVHVTCFATGAYADQRSDARNRVESYVTKGVETRYTLFGDHFVGQRSISFYCVPGVPGPDVNQVIALSTEKPSPYSGGILPSQDVQFFRVKGITSRTRQTFYDDQNTPFDKDVIVIETTTALLYDFLGQEVFRRTDIKPYTRIRATSVADAASYYSVRAVEVDLDIGDSVVKTASPYVPLVPSNNAETAVIDQPATLGDVTIIKSGASAVTVSLTYAGSTDETDTNYCGSGIARNGLTMTAGAITLIDDGNGNMVPPGFASASGYTGQVDYATGAITLSRNQAFNAEWTTQFIPGTAFNQQVFSQRIPITSLNRQYTYVAILQPFPNAGALRISYLALGKWITLYDNGQGNLTGDVAGYGSGTVNYATGSVSVTLGALPDNESSVIFAWGTALRTQERSGDAAIQPARIKHTLANLTVVPGSIVITWLDSATPVVAHDDGESNILDVSNVVIGRVLYSTGEIEFTTTQIPDDNSNVVYEYDWRLTRSQTFTGLTISGGGNVSFTLSHFPVKEGSLVLKYQTVDTTAYGIGIYRRNVNVTVVDDGAGNLVGFRRDGADVPPGWGAIGTIDYATGDCQFQAEQTAPGWVPSFGISDNGRCVTLTGWSVDDLGYLFESGTPVVANWVEDSAADTSVIETIEAPAVEFDLTPLITEPVVPGSVRFTFRGNTYVDRFGGLYKNPSATSNAAVLAGTIDYNTGFALLTDFAGTGRSGAVSVKSLLTRFTETGVTALYFRTNGAPVKAGSFVCRANALEGGDLLVGTADINGVITGDQIVGNINHKSGTVEVTFGEMVTAAGNEAAPWYDADNIVSGMIWRPTVIDPNTATFNTVFFRSIPQNSEQIGLDPVRLPEDGRVLCFKEGDVAVVHNTLVYSVSPASSDVVNVGRTNLDELEVRDTDGVPVLSIWYTLNLTAGTVTFSPTLDLTGYVLPLKIRHRIEEIRQIVDVQITGELTLNAPLSKAFDTVGTYVSSALVIGDMQSRVFNVYDQDTWTGVWSDTLIGNPVAGANYNATLYPLDVLNRDAITERWAVIFSSSSSFSVVGEVSGVVASGTITADIEPNNPLTGFPYFVMHKEGWGTGWAAGNVVRFNTIGSLAPIWFVRTTLVASPTTTTDNFRFQIIGNAA